MNFFAIVEQGGSSDEVRRIRMSQALQSHLTVMFEEQRQNLIGECELIEFDPRYKPDDDEIFVIKTYRLSQFIEDAVRHINQVEDLSLESGARIKAVFAADHDLGTTNSLRVFFQGFMKSQLLIGGWTLLQQQNTYRKLKDPGLVLGSSLVAVYDERNSLYFRSYILVSRFLDLTEHFAEATNADIKDVLDDEKFQVDDESAILEGADSVMRKRFMAVKASGILAHVTVKKAQAQAAKFGLKVRINGGRIVFPSERKEVKALLRLLLEGYYEGPLTGNKYMTNSQKPVGK